MPSLSTRFMRSALKIFYALLYHRMAWTYDWVAYLVSVGLWQTWVKAVLPWLNGPRLLEIGHGPGHLLSELLSNENPAYLAVGLDRSKQMGRITRKQLSRKDLHPDLVNGHSQHLPFPSGSFDQIVATFPTEYIADPLTIDEIWRVLDAEGSLVILLGAWITGKRLHERAAAALFHITGQTPQIDERALIPAAKAGFNARIEWIHLETSKLAVVIASKTEK
jgi:ubiquinone/menaquinone biosynthesis C-methylase UbiE